MFKGLFSKLLDLNQREVERLTKISEAVNALEPKMKKLKAADFVKKTLEFKKRIAGGESLENIMPEAFALAREAAARTVGMRPFDVQIMAATALFEGKIAEQKTGEGKTLSAVPALYLRALVGRGAHLVTVNDYLARRDAGWNGPVFDLLGLSVGSIVQENHSFVYDPKFVDSSHTDARLAHLKPAQRKDAYQADITYGTNNEFGFDYLRDNMVGSLADMVQRGHYFAIVDEVDSVLIDEARTPLIISAPDTEPTKKYYDYAHLIEKLNPETDYKIDEKQRSASLTERGVARVESILGIDNLYEKDFRAVHHIENALRAKTLYLRDRDYITKDNEVVIVDEFTGRIMVGRRWSDGMHQAVEAKEGVPIKEESKTLATISFQNYFRMYEHLSGMTGTAATEAEEFKKIYNLEVVVVPTNKPMIRQDQPDLVYKNLSAKYSALAREIEEKYRSGQPVLVGTTSIEKNELVSQYLKRKKIPHNLLNAKNHEKEAMIIAQAGKPGAVTVATNMAGRGVDVILGGAPPELGSKAYDAWKKEHDKVVEAGGLHVIGTERHESRRIDNQLRGRSGRQGDPGSSRFYLSLEDDLMRIFGGDQIKSLMDRFNLPEDQPIENSLVSKAIEQAQVKVEGFNFDSRKNVVEYDDVVNQQRDIVYKLRKRILESTNLKDEILQKLDLGVERIVQLAISVESGKPDLEKVIIGLRDIVPFDDESVERIKKELEKTNNGEEIKTLLSKIIRDVQATREKQLGERLAREVEKYAYLSSIDHLWIDHIDRIDDLKDGVRLRGYAQKDPLVEFKNEAFGMFEDLMQNIDQEIGRRIFRIGVSQRPEVPPETMQENVDKSDMTGLATPSKLGRNDPCWCGSGKKWKRCHYPQLSK